MISWQLLWFFHIDLLLSIKILIETSLRFKIEILIEMR